MTPRLPIRRFDVFAEYSRLRALKKGMDDAHARGYGLWVAKVVASGGGGRRAASQEPHHPGGEGGAAHDQRPAEAPEWHDLSGEPQTDALFDKEIVQRMGADFYREVFAPAIADAFAQGKSYESIRDTVRKPWSVERGA